MGTTAQKLNRVLQTKSDLKTVINYSGANITNETTFKDYSKLLNKAYIDILNDEGESLYNALPKTIETGTNINLFTEKGKMKIELKGDTQQEGTPTPSNPQNVEVVTGEQNVEIVGKNLFDKDTITTGYYISNTGEIKPNNNFAISDFISVIPNNIYTYLGTHIQSSYGAKAGFYDKNKNWISSLSLNLSATFVVPNNAYYFRTSLQISQNDQNTFQLEKGSIATEYEPYQSQNYPINLGKNLFDKDNANIINGYFDDSHNTITSNANARTLYISCQPNTTYTISKLRNWQFNVACTETKPEINTSISDTNVNGTINDYDGSTKVSLTYTTNATANYLLVRYTHVAQVSDEIMLPSIQIEKGSQVTEYAPYKTPIELCKIGDYQDYIYNQNGDWYLHKETNKAILNGGSNEIYNYQNNHRFWLKRSYWTNETVPFNPPENVLQGLYCNRFVERTRSQTWAGTEGISYDNPNTTDQPIGSTFTIACNSVATNETDLKAWLSNNPLEVVYILQNQQDIQITNTALIQQLDNLKNAKSYDDVTHIMQTNDDLSFNLEVSALAKIE